MIFKYDGCSKIKFSNKLQSRGSELAWIWQQRCVAVNWKLKQSKLCWPSSFPNAEKFKKMPLAKKKLAFVFKDTKGVSQVERGITIDTARFCETLTKLCRAIRSNSGDRLTKGVRLYNDNDRPCHDGSHRQICVGNHWSSFVQPWLAPQWLLFVPQLETTLYLVTKSWGSSLFY